MVKVSVIVPVYNACNNIRNTLNHIITQNFDDFEIIIVDDGSKDDSVKTIKEIMLNSKINYKLIQQENAGSSAARNRGLIESSGKYIVFVDDDDLIGENHLKDLYCSMINQNTSFAFTEMFKINKDFKYLSSLNAYDILKNKSKISTKDLIKQELLMKIPFSFCQIMYDKSIINKFNLKFNEKIDYGEDTDFALRNLIHGENVSLTNNGSYFYLQHESLTSKSFLNRFDFVFVLEDLADYYSQINESKNKELINLIYTYRIPKAIFGNLMFLFYKDYPFDEIMEYMKDKDILNKLNNFKPINHSDFKFQLKIKSFLINPKIYYKFWKSTKNSI